ncbi:MAG: dTMP kinase [Spirochaetota bacterium]
MKGRSDPLKGFVVIEGIDGSGTTTQMRLLSERLRATGRSAWLTSEPTERPMGLVARRILSGELEVSPETVAHVFAADRCDHLTSPGGIREHLERGELVVCDRYKYSSLAYQGIDADETLVARLNDAFDDPELVLFLDVPVDVGEQRLASRPSREIYERLEYQERVRARYLRILGRAREATTVEVIDATAGEAEIAGKIWRALEEASIL